jgi:hypothetical protein
MGKKSLSEHLVAEFLNPKEVFSSGDLKIQKRYLVAEF